MDKIIEQLFVEIRSHMRLASRADSSISFIRQTGRMVEKATQFADLKEIRAEAEANAEKIREAIDLLREVK